MAKNRPGPRTAADLSSPVEATVGGGEFKPLPPVEQGTEDELRLSLPAATANVTDESGTPSGVNPGSPTGSDHDDHEADVDDGGGRPSLTLTAEEDAALARSLADPLNFGDAESLSDIEDLVEGFENFGALLSDVANNINFRTQACVESDRAALLPPRTPSDDAVAAALGNWTKTANADGVLHWRQQPVEATERLKAAVRKFDAAKAAAIGACDAACARRLNVAQFVLFDRAAARAKAEAAKK